MQRNAARIAAALLAPMMIATVLAGCGSQDRQETAQATAGTVQEGQRVASSLSERIAFLLDMDASQSTHMSERQRTMLERALGNGGVVTKADYEQAYSNFQQCVVDKGYNRPELTLYPDGLHGIDLGWRDAEYLDENGYPTKAHEKVDTDIGDCWVAEHAYVDELYKYTVGNADLYLDSSVGIPACLRREHLVPASYTPAQFTQEWDAYNDMRTEIFTTDRHDTQGRAKAEFSFDLTDPKAQTCFIANRVDILAEDWDSWTP